MTEPDFPYKKPQPENPPEENDIPTSPDIKNPKIEEQPIEQEEAGLFRCRICGRSFNTQAELDLHMGTSHKVAQGKKQ